MDQAELILAYAIAAAIGCAVVGYFGNKELNKEVESQMNAKSENESK